MFQPKDLLFAGVKPKIKQFLTKYAGIEDGVCHKQYQEAYERYTEITSDPDFQEKILELTYLETMIAQVHCMQNIDPRYTIAETSIKNTFVYARMPYPRPTVGIHVISSSIGTINEFGEYPKKNSYKPAAIAEYYTTLLPKMKPEFLYH